ncbi:Phosphate-induced protein 1 [Corchorus capsularis]|uniref:Phosphate-induced protein 1 n=1 Tax=Corchorus capsularis TaxID=210143 RepID=A0A1R3J371_COCAP|nr:Phosphate-induced protein 1 [Corchorus capsularis]
MASSIQQVSFALFLLLPFTPSFTYGQMPPPITMAYHGGPVVNGNLNIVMVWYGRCGRILKNTMRNFVKSLNAGAGLEPSVLAWWRVVESYQNALPGANLAGLPAPPITVTVVKQITDTSYKYGKILTSVDVIPQMAHDATNGDPHLLPIIVTARDVTVQGLCIGKCADHGVFDLNKPYIIVGNPETECPGACGWPFHEPDVGPKGVVLMPPNLNLAADAMVASLATALADTVASPLNSGFYEGNVVNPVGPGSVCRDHFGSGAFPGNPGKVLIDPASGGAFNAYGNKGKKFLLPAIWDPKTNACWTLI